MWKDKLKEVIYILENSDINEIEVRFWFRKIKVTKNPPTINSDFSTSSLILSISNNSLFFPFNILPEGSLSF